MRQRSPRRASRPIPRYSSPSSPMGMPGGDTTGFAGENLSGSRWNSSKRASNPARCLVSAESGDPTAFRHSLVTCTRCARTSARAWVEAVAFMASDSIASKARLSTARSTSDPKFPVASGRSATTFDTASRRKLSEGESADRALYCIRRDARSGSSSTFRVRSAADSAVAIGSKVRPVSEGNCDRCWRCPGVADPPCRPDAIR